MFLKSPLVLRSGVSLGLALLTLHTNASTGEVTIEGYWNFTTGGWEAAFDKTKHLKPFVRLDGADDGDAPDFKLQAVSVPFEPVDRGAPIANCYTLDEAGDRGDLAGTFDNAYLRGLGGLA